MIGSPGFGGGPVSPGQPQLTWGGLRGATGARVAVAADDRKCVPTGVETVTVDSSGKAVKAEKTEAGDQADRAAGDERPGRADAGRAAAKPEEIGTVRVTSVPDGAEVFIDGSFVGNAPAQLKLSPGKHKVDVKAEGHEDWTREIQVLAGSDLNLKATPVKK